MAWPKKPKLETLSSLTRKAAAASKPATRTYRTKSGIVRIRHGYGQPADWYALKAEVHARDGGQCVQCGSTEHLHAHHIHRESRGGALTARNLITLCEFCHSQRHSHMKRR